MIKFILIVLFTVFTCSLCLAKVDYTAGNLRDPFMSLLPKKEEQIVIKPEKTELAQEEIQLPEMYVQGMIWGGRYPTAIVDNRVVKIGDRIGEAEVTGISREGVQLLYHNRYFLIRPQISASASRSEGSSKSASEQGSARKEDEQPKTEKGKGDLQAKSESGQGN
jgi:hypothetical protein